MTTERTTALESRAANDLWSDWDTWFDGVRSRLFGADHDGPHVTWIAPPTLFRIGGPTIRSARADVTETGTAYRITAELPGIAKEQLQIRVRGNAVEIEAQETTTTGSAAGELVHQERTHRGFYRAIELPEPVVGKDATAKLTNGILELELPKQTPTPALDEVQVPVQ